MSEKLNICLISIDYPPDIIGGVGTYTQSLAINLAKRGHSIYIIAASKITNRNNHSNIKYYICPNRSTLSFFNFTYKTLKKLTQNRKLDIIHGSDLYHLPAILFKNQNTAIVTTTHISYWQRLMLHDVQRKWKYPLPILVEQLLFLLTNRIIGVSEFCMKYIESYPFVKSKTTVIPNGVNTDLYTINRSTYLHDKLKLDKNKPCILFAGRMAEQKHPTLICQLAQKHFPPEWQIVFVGKGPLETEVIKYAEETPNIYYYGKGEMSEMPDIYSSSDVFLLPSTSEGLAFSLLEASSCGIPTITSKNGTYKNLVENDISGAILELNATPQEWTVAITKCLENREKYGNNARQKIIDLGLTEKDFINSHEQLFMDLTACN